MSQEAEVKFGEMYAWLICKIRKIELYIMFDILTKPIVRNSRLANMRAKAPICDTLLSSVFVANVSKTCKLHEVCGTNFQNGGRTEQNI